MKEDEMDGNCLHPMISSGNALHEEKNVANEEDHNSCMFGLPFDYIHILTLLYYFLCFKICAFRNKIKSSECSVVENKRKNWAEDGS